MKPHTLIKPLQSLAITDFITHHSKTTLLTNVKVSCSSSILFGNCILSSYLYIVEQQITLKQYIMNSTDKLIQDYLTKQEASKWIFTHDPSKK